MIAIRPMTPADAAECGRILFTAHQAVAAAHGFPPEQPSLEFAQNLARFKLADVNAAAMAAEQDGVMTGSIFLNFFPGTSVAAIGPLTVDPERQGGAGRVLMEWAVEEAFKRGFERVRLVQSPFHLRSLALYTKAGFAVREPLAFIARPAGFNPRNTARLAAKEDFEACDRLAHEVLGFSRGFELRSAKDPMVVERDGRITGYAAGLGMRGHAVAEQTSDLAALIHSASAVQGPGFFVPTRNDELLRDLLAAGYRCLWPATLMTLGPWEQPAGAFLPSIAY